MAQTNSRYIHYYTAGSAARKLAPVIPLNNPALPRTRAQQKRIKIYLDPVALFGTVVAVAMLITMLVGVSALQAEQAKTATMVEYVESLRVENEALRTQYAEKCNLAEIEEAALALGMVPKEEVTHTLIQVELPAE